MIRLGLAILVGAAASADVSEGIPAFQPARLGLLASLCPHAQTVTAIGFTPDGRALVTAGEDGEIHLIRAGSWKIERTIRETAACFAISPDSRRLVTATHEGSIRVWELATGKMERELSAEPVFAQKLAYSPDGRKIAAVSQESEGVIWDAATGKTLAKIERLSPNSPAAAFTPDGSEFIGVRENGVIAVFSSADGKPKFQFEPLAEPVKIALARNGRTLVSASADGRLRVMDLPSRKIVRTIGEEALENMPVLAITDDGRYALGSAGFPLDVHDLRSGEKRASLKHHTGAIFQIDVSRDARLIATAASDSQIKIWGFRADGMARVKPKGFLGVVLTDDGAPGAVVEQVIEGSAAEKAGIKVGDRVVKIGTVDVKSTWQAIGNIGANEEGAEIAVTIERDGKSQTFKATLGPRPENMDK